MTDPIADMLTRIRNAYMAKQSETVIPHSNLKLAVAEKLAQLGYLTQVDVSEAGVGKVIKVGLKYKDKHPVLSGIKRVSTPGRRIYTTAKEIKPVLSGYGSALISTSKGVLSDKEARSTGTGGEVICKVW